MPSPISSPKLPHTTGLNQTNSATAVGASSAEQLPSNKRQRDPSQPPSVHRRVNRPPSLQSQRPDRNLNATSPARDTSAISTTLSAGGGTESRGLSGRSLERLDLPLGEVFGPNVIQGMASNNASTILLDGGKLSASYDPKYKIVRANFGDRSPTGLGPVNVELDESGQNVKRIWGMPPPTKTDLQYWGYTPEPPKIPSTPILN